MAVQELVAPCESVTVNITSVVPSGYSPAGVCVTVIASPSGSDEPLLIDALNELDCGNSENRGGRVGELRITGGRGVGDSFKHTAINKEDVAVWPRPTVIAHPEAALVPLPRNGGEVLGEEAGVADRPGFGRVRAAM